MVERICELIDRGFRPCGHHGAGARGHGRREGRRRAAGVQAPQRGAALPVRRDDAGGAASWATPPCSSFIAAALRLALDPDDTLNRAVYNHYLGRDFDRELPDGERSFFRSIRLLSPEEAFERIVMRHDLTGDRRQIAYLQAIHEQIIAFSAAKIADIALFLRWWDEQGRNRSLSVEQSATTVEITTVHKAKGLEKRAVIIPYCSWQLDPKSGGNVQNIVWAEARDGEAAAIGRFPVRYKRAMAESSFSAEYYRELVYAHVDNVNLLYVALTRAAESLHVFVPQKGGAPNVGGLLLQSIHVEGDRATVGTLEGRYTADERGEHYVFGEFAGPVAGGAKDAEAEHVLLEEYPTAQAALRLRLPSQRYFEEGGETELAPRNFGILMHRAFEQAEDERQIREAVDAMRADGTLTDDQAARLGKAIDRALELPEVREWFGGGWQEVRNEQEIILPRPADGADCLPGVPNDTDDRSGAPNGTTRRPDRVMIAGDRAVVVDYKFGDRDAERYRRQIGGYCTLLRGMGYARVEGYLWYVRRGEVERVV